MRDVVLPRPESSNEHASPSWFGLAWQLEAICTAERVYHIPQRLPLSPEAGLGCVDTDSRYN